MLRELSGEADGGQAALADIVQTYVRAGDLAGARTYLEGVRAESPAAPLPRLMLAGLDALEGRTAAAEAGYRALIADEPRLRPGLRGALPGCSARPSRRPPPRRWRKAWRRPAGTRGSCSSRRAGSRPRATSRARSPPTRRSTPGTSGSALVANNLASLLSSHRADPAALERAFAIARRLQGQRRAAVPGHLRLDPGPARRGRGGAARSRGGRRGAARASPWCSTTSGSPRPGSGSREAARDEPRGRAGRGRPRRPPPPRCRGPRAARRARSAPPAPRPGELAPLAQACAGGPNPLIPNGVGWRV